LQSLGKHPASEKQTEGQQAYYANQASKINNQHEVQKESTRFSSEERSLPYAGQESREKSTQGSNSKASFPGHKVNSNSSPDVGNQGTLSLKQTSKSTILRQSILGDQSPTVA